MFPKKIIEQSRPEIKYSPPFIQILKAEYIHENKNATIPL